MNTITLILIFTAEIYTRVHGASTLITSLVYTLEPDPREGTQDSYSNTNSHICIRPDTKIGQHHTLEESLYMTMDAPLVFQIPLRQEEGPRERSPEVHM